jgi:hypothetical protein
MEGAAMSRLKKKAAPLVTPFERTADVVSADLAAEIGVPIIQGKTITLQVPIIPTTVPTTGQRITEKFYQFSLPPRASGYKVREIRSFLGLDQTNYGEYAIDLSCSLGRIYSRSMHKETPRAMYEAWERVRLSSDWDLGGGTVGATVVLDLHILAHQTAIGSEPKTGNAGYEVIIETE